MAEPLVNKRYNLGDGVLHMEMLPVPNIFLDGDYNTNTELIWDFFSTFVSSTFGAIRTNGYTVSIVGDDIQVSSGVIWYDRFYINNTTSTNFENGRNIGTEQYLYLRITHERITIEDDLVSESDVNLVTIRQNVNGLDVSRPNQYRYTSELQVTSSTQIDSLGNLPSGDDVYYILVATINTDETITYNIRNFGTVLSTEQIPENLEEIVNQNTSDIQTLQNEDVNNAKRDEDNVFLGTNSETSNTASYDSINQRINLGVGNIGILSINGTFNVISISSKAVGTNFRLKIIGTGSIIFNNSSSLVCPGDNNLIVPAGNWIEFIKISTDGWEIVSNSTSNTASINTNGRIPLGSIINFEGSHSQFDGTGRGNSINTSGWALCNGQNGTPDLRGRVIISMSDVDVDYALVGNTGGSKNITLSIGQLPSHSFTVTGTTSSAGGHSHNLTADSDFGGSGTVVGLGGGTSNDSTLTTSAEPNHSHTVTGTTNTIGNGDEIDLRSPYYVLATIKRIS